MIKWYVHGLYSAEYDHWYRVESSLGGISNWRFYWGGGSMSCWNTQKVSQISMKLLCYSLTMVINMRKWYENGFSPIDASGMAPLTVATLAWLTTSSYIDLELVRNTFSFVESISWIKKAGSAYIDTTIRVFVTHNQ